MKPINGSAALRKGRVSQKGYLYHITLPVENREFVFLDFSKAQLLKRCLKNSDDNGHTETYSFCIMPDHLHWMFQLKSASLSKVIAKVKSEYSRFTRTKIWQDGYHDHAIRSDESLINIARYIVRNPLRAGLVSKVGDYPHWDSIWLK
jgi:putative transposase